MGLRNPQLADQNQSVGTFAVSDAKTCNDPTEQGRAIKSYSETKDSRILYQGLTQAALQSTGLTIFDNADRAAYIASVKAAVDELAAFVLERAK